MTRTEPFLSLGSESCLGFAACLTRAGFDVLGVDVDVRLVECINDKAWVFDEPGVASAIAEATGGTLRATTQYGFRPAMTSCVTIQRSTIFARAPQSLLHAPAYGPQTFLWRTDSLSMPNLLSHIAAR